MKHTVQLKQHTPIIHFQYNQTGASLRATELKPKIDRFVLRDLQRVDPVLFDRNRTLINENFSSEPKASKYKITVTANHTTQIRPMKFASSFSRREREDLGAMNITLKPNSPYFGKFFAVSHTNVNIEIFSFNDALARFIVEILPDVLAYNNFGSRQSKGFGSFLPADLTETQIKIILKRKYHTFWEIDAGNDPFPVIHQSYQLLKSGRNQPNRRLYEKSELFNYMCVRNIRWEKRKIKTEMKTSYPMTFDKLKHETTSMRIKDCIGSEDQGCPHKYVRALLGLAEHNEYAANNSDPAIDKIQIKIKDARGEIERFRSPIIFKVFNNKVFLLPEEIPEEMFNRDFEFSLYEKCRRGSPKSIGRLCTLPTPDPGDFILEEFLTAHLPNVNAIIGQQWTLVP